MYEYSCSGVQGNKELEVAYIADSFHDNYRLFGGFGNLSNFLLIMWQEALVFGLFVTVIGGWVYRTWFHKGAKPQSGCGCDKCG